MSARRALLVALASLAVPRLVVGQTAQKVWRIGYLSLGLPEGDRKWVAALRDQLNKLGYVEGKARADAIFLAPTKFDLVINLKTTKAWGCRFRKRCCPAPTM